MGSDPLHPTVMIDGSVSGKGSDPIVAPIAIIGAGPAGLMAAEVLASRGSPVIVFDAMPSVGRKLLMAGRGGLNLTHSEPLDVFLTRYGAAAAALEPAIRAFPPEALIAWANTLGQETFVGSSGRVFPKSLKASPLLRSWLKRLEALGIEIRTRHRWIGWSETGALRFAVDGGAIAEVMAGAGQTIEITASATLLALGGASWPRLGSDGAWSQILADAGVALTPFAPANAGVDVAWSEHVRSRFAGEPLKRIAITYAGVTRRGECIVTRNGLEGGPVYAFTPALRDALAKGTRPAITLDLRPDLSMQELAGRLAAPRGKQSGSNFLRKAAQLSPVAIALLREGATGPLPSDPLLLAERIKGVGLDVQGVAGLARAISSAGGVRLDAVDENLMLHAKPGVFVAGEMLDWEAPTGGYLLQAAFATSRHAADGLVQWLAATSKRTLSGAPT